MQWIAAEAQNPWAAARVEVSGRQAPAVVTNEKGQPAGLPQTTSARVRFVSYSKPLGQRGAEDLQAVLDEVRLRFVSFPARQLGPLALGGALPCIDRALDARLLLLQNHLALLL